MLSHLPRTLAACALVLLCSCNDERLYVQSEYISYKDLASAHVGTPDPRKFCPDTGQRLLVYWSLPQDLLKDGPLDLRLEMRYGNGEEMVVVRPIPKGTGLLIYDLLNEDFFEKDGIRSYQAQILRDDEVIERWCHQIWTNKIDFPEPATKS